MIGNRVREAREYAGFNLDIFSEKINISKRTLQNYEKNISEPNASIIINIAEICHINEWWLLTGKGEMLLNDNDKNPKNETKSDSNSVNISYFKDTYAAAGVGAINYDKAPVVMSFDKDFLKAQLGITVFKHLHIIHAIGNSMYPTIQTGEMLFVNPFENEDLKIRDKDIYVINTPNGILVKRIKIHPIKPIYILVSDNPDDEDITLEGDDFLACTIIGRVIGHFNKL